MLEKEGILKNVSLLIVEDDSDTRDELVFMLRGDMREIHDASNGQEALEQFESAHPDIVLTDVNMPEINGVKLAQMIKERSPDTSIIFMSAHSEMEYINSAMEAGGLEYLLKPIEVDELISKIITITQKKSIPA